jgi:AAA+ ATPase superfamily predicted ATPase
VHYVIKDRLLASYFVFIYPNYKDMLASDIDDAWKYIAANLSQYLGHVFEDLCREYVQKHGYPNAGKWWSGPKEIDVAASNDDTLLLAECKYRNELTDADLIDDLLDKSKSVNPKKLSKRYALFSKSGYTNVARLRAETYGIELINLKDMF